MSKGYEEFHSWLKGWQDGARFSAMDKKFTEHRLKEHYEKGYEEGRVSRREACKVAMKRYKYKPNILRACKS